MMRTKALSILGEQAKIDINRPNDTGVEPEQFPGKISSVRRGEAFIIT
jgi:hypothetical protein